MGATKLESLVAQLDAQTTRSNGNGYADSLTIAAMTDAEYVKAAEAAAKLDTDAMGPGGKAAVTKYRRRLAEDGKRRIGAK